MIIPQKYTDKFILWCVTVAAVIVAVSQFIYRAWVENDINTKICTFTNKTFTIIRNISNVIVEETEPNVL